MKQRIEALRPFERANISPDHALPLDETDAIERTLLISFIGAVLSLIVLGGLAYRAATQHSETLSHIARAQDALKALADVQVDVSRMESRYRAYVITDDRNYLGDHENLASKMDRFKQKLAQATLPGDMVISPGVIQEIGQRLAHRSMLLERMAALRDAQPANTVEEFSLIAEGKRETEVIEFLIREVEQRLVAMQRLAEENVNHESRKIITLFWAMALVTILFLALMFWQIRLEARRRKNIRQQLIERERNLQEIVNAAVDGMIVIDSSGIMQSMNPAAEHIFGYSEEEVVGRNVSMLMPEPYRSQHDNYLEHYLRTGEKRIIGIGREVSGLRKNGDIFPMELAVGETHAGVERRFIGVVRDISSRKQAEREQGKLMASLSAANDELRSFSYVVSHDLKAPLRAIGSLADWLRLDYGDKLGEEGNQQISLLVGRVQRMDRLIDGILAYSRAGRPAEHLVLVSSEEALKGALDLIDIPENMKVTVEASLPKVAAERIRLQQVFQNLVSNAIRHANVPNGEIHIGCRAQGNYWQFHVCDNGPGIEPRNFERIFQLFQTLLPRDTAENSGVGLAIVKKVVELYGGKVWVESEKGKGACFYFSLPKQLAYDKKMEPNHAHG